MYIEFQLPSGAGGAAAGHALELIKHELDQWAVQNNVKYRTKVVKYTLRFCLDTEQEYTHFLMSWNPKSSAAKRYTVVDPGHQKN